MPTWRPLGRATDPSLNSTGTTPWSTNTQETYSPITQSLQDYVVWISHASGTRLLLEQVQSSIDSLTQLAKRLLDIQSYHHILLKGEAITCSKRISIKPKAFVYIYHSPLYGIHHNHFMLEFSWFASSIIIRSTGFTLDNSRSHWSNTYRI